MKKVVEGMTSRKFLLLKLVDYMESYGQHLISKYADYIKEDINIVCDLGVGEGRDLQIFKARHPEATLIGVDFSDMNATKLLAKGIELKIHNIELDELDLPDHSVDVIIINQVLEHVKEVFWIHHQIAKKLRQGGYLVIGIPNISSFANRIMFLAGKQPTQMKTYSAHVRGYAFNEIPDFFKVCFPGGYRLVKRNGAQFYPFPKRTSRFLCSIFPSMAHSAFYLFKKDKEYNGEFLQHPVKAQLETNFYLG